MLGESADVRTQATRRVLVVSGPVTRERVPELFLRLLDADVELVFAVSDNGLPAAIRNHPGASAVELPLERKAPETGAVTLFRAAADLVPFLRSDLERARRPRVCALRRLLQLAGQPNSQAIVQGWADLQLPRDVCAKLSRACRNLEQLLPPEPELEHAVARLDVSVVLIVAHCLPGGVDPDAVKVARRLGLPSIMLVGSRDALSGKTVLNEHPDRLIVWNERQAAEAVELHAVPRERIAVPGAPSVDGLFELVSPAIAELARTASAGVARAEGPGPSGKSDLILSSETGNGGLHRGVRILVFSAPALVRNVPEVFTALLEADASLIFTGKRLEKLRIPDELLAHSRASVAPLALRAPGGAGSSVTLFRGFADLNRLLGGDVDHGSWARTHAARRLLKLMHHPEYAELCSKAAHVSLPSDVHVQLTTAFRDFERLLPAPPELTEAIDRLRVDSVAFVTRCSYGGSEPDVIKAARQLDIPSIMLVWSWDNLTSKAILNEHPDQLIVWNDIQATEAVQIHGVPPQQVLVAGAPNFDRFFAEVERHAGTWAPPPPNEPGTILYLGSSSDVAQDEPAIFAKWIAAVRSSADPVVRDATVIVRPHPADRAWVSWSPPDTRVLLAPAGGKIEPETLSHLLTRIDVVVALNTTAEIEAAIANRPVLTFRAGLSAPGQEGRLHFSYLLEEQGGFVIDAATLQEHAQRLGAVLCGGYDPTPIRRFVERFVRPAGLEQPVSPLVASAVLELARRPMPVGP
jgi:hypothetical protein